MGIPEHLPGTSEAIAAQARLPLDSARRLLRALGELGVVTCAGGEWTLTASGAFLRRDHRETLAGAAEEYPGPLSRRWALLPEALRAGDAWRPPNVFDEVAASPARTRRHGQMLTSDARHDYSAVAQTIAGAGHRRIIDAGGGEGALLFDLLARASGATSVLLERPEVLEGVSVPVALHGRVELRAADLFQPWCVSGDAVILARVLHDWPDTGAVEILRHARAALAPGGRLYVVELLLEPDSFSGGLCDLHLMAVAGGRERTREEMAGLLKQSGFALEAVRPLGPVVSLVSAT